MLFPDLGDALLPLRERHPGQRGLMACQPFPRQQTWLQRASRQLQGQGGRETKDVLVLYVMYGVVNDWWCCSFPTSLRTPIHHLHDTSTLLLLCPMQPRYIGHTAPHTAFGCGEQVPDVVVPHYGDARMQHSQSTQPALPGVTTAHAPRGVPASTNEVFPASPT